MFPEFRALREYSHALRLASELADLRAANANRILPPWAAEPGPMEGCVNPKRKTSPLDWFSFWHALTKKMPA